MTRTARSLVVVLVALAAACDRAPTDPSVDVQSIISAADPVAAQEIQSLRYTLPALFRESVSRTYARGGKAGVDALLSDWHDRQELLKKRAQSADHSVIQGDIEAIRQEELKVVLTALGNEAVTRALSDLKVNVAQTEALMMSAQMDGIETRGTNVLQQVRDKVRAADVLARQGKSLQSLDVLTQASTILSGLDYYLIEVRRIGGVEALYPKAVKTIMAGDDATAKALLKQSEDATEAARVALRSQDRDVAREKLEDARKRQIELVVKTLGPNAANQLVVELGVRSAAMRDSVNTLRKNGQDVVRLERMLREANDLAARAKAAANQKDYATAIDLGSHAAGMLNALQHLAK